MTIIAALRRIKSILVSREKRKVVAAAVYDGCRRQNIMVDEVRAERVPWGGV